MRVTLLFAIAFCLTVSAVFAKKHHQKEEKKQNAQEKLKKLEEKIKKETEQSIKQGTETVLVDPCSKVYCDPGKECVVQEDRTATCECVKQCHEQKDERRKVCSNYNETWPSDCHLYQMNCFCEQSKDGCTDEKYSHMHIDYYGTCREIKDCTREEMDDFPRRMREWLFNVMQDLARRQALNEPYKKLEKEAEGSQSRQWVNAVIWKFCDLDAKPSDRSVSRHELFPLRAPLLAMEHCIAPFLNGCDADDDHTITLKEWGVCLGLEDSEIKDRCAQING